MVRPLRAKFPQVAFPQRIRPQISASRNFDKFSPRPPAACHCSSMSGLSAPRAAALPPTLANKCTMYAHIFAHGQGPDGEKKAEYALQDLLQTTLQCTYSMFLRLWSLFYMFCSTRLVHGVSTSESSSSSSPNPKKRRRAPKAAELEELVTKAQNVDNDVNHSSASVVSPATVAAQLLKRTQQLYSTTIESQSLYTFILCELVHSYPHTDNTDTNVHSLTTTLRRQSCYPCT